MGSGIPTRAQVDTMEDYNMRIALITKHASFAEMHAHSAAVLVFKLCFDCLLRWCSTVFSRFLLFAVSPSDYACWQAERNTNIVDRGIHRALQDMPRDVVSHAHLQESKEDITSKYRAKRELVDKTKTALQNLLNGSLSSFTMLCMYASSLQSTCSFQSLLN